MRDIRGAALRLLQKLGIEPLLYNVKDAEREVLRYLAMRDAVADQEHAELRQAAGIGDDQTMVSR